jgi:hypothetical protein
MTINLYIESDLFAVDSFESFPDFESGLIAFDSKVGEYIRRLATIEEESFGLSPEEIRDFKAAVRYVFRDTITGGPGVLSPGERGEITFSVIEEYSTALEITLEEVG